MNNIETKMSREELEQYIKDSLNRKGSTFVKGTWQKVEYGYYEAVLDGGVAVLKFRKNVVYEPIKIRYCVSEIEYYIIVRFEIRFEIKSDSGGMLSISTQRVVKSMLNDSKKHAKIEKMIREISLHTEQTFGFSVSEYDFV